MKKISSLIFLMLFFCKIVNGFELLPFRQVVIWGHKLHSHTHSYVHEAFYRTFNYLGYKTLWLDNNDSLAGVDFSASLFITEGQVDQKIPLRDDAFYILHNCDWGKYKNLLEKNRVLKLQVYTNRCRTPECITFAPYVLFNPREQCLYMPWATDLLPYEIDQVKERMKKNRALNKVVVFIGTLGYGVFGNIPECKPFFEAADQKGIPAKHFVDVDPRKAQDIIEHAFIAPAIQGSWQCREGYIPCRIFKNISYGKLGVTNCPVVYDLFNHKIVFDTDTKKLFKKALKRMDTITLQEQFDLMNFVRDHHTYINRIEHLFKAISLIKKD